MTTKTVEETVTKARKTRSTNSAALRNRVTKLALSATATLDKLSALVPGLDEAAREKVVLVVGEAYDDFVTASTTTKSTRTLEL